MHPFPRINEIPTEFDIDERAKYFDQIKFGVWCRQILLERVMK
jgi:aspartate carbamoyltransferase catalytic subunit